MANIHYTTVQFNDDYKPFTLNVHNEKRRLSYLPCFPPRIDSLQTSSSQLLLANVPRCCLSLRQLLQRDSEIFSIQPFHPLITYHHDHGYPSFAYDIFRRHFSNLIERLKVDLSIIDYNLVRLNTFILNEYPVIFRNNETFNFLLLNYDEMAIGLEYYLQMDVDIFYMKTCSYGCAQQFSLDHSLFNNRTDLEVLYTLQPCQEINCSLCQTSLSSMIRFNAYEIHRFHNGYQSILNCPATCITKNIIYVLTCPCGEYEFIGSTKGNLDNVLLYYRKQLNRFIYEHLTGLHSHMDTLSMSSLFSSSISDSLLYEHAIKCPSILKLFLQFNPQYNCFLPLLLQNFIRDPLLININDSSSPLSPSSLSLASSPLPPSPCSPSSIVNMSPRQSMSDRLQKSTLISYQHRQQHDFSHQYISNQDMFSNSIDLYRITILCVLPESTSCHLRKIIQALYILHAEPKLN